MSFVFSVLNKIPKSCHRAHGVKLRELSNQEEAGVREELLGATSILSKGH